MKSNTKTSIVVSIDDKSLLRVGKIVNFYGGLVVKEVDGSYYWGMENYDNFIELEEIPEYLYHSLVRYENERQQER